MPAGDEEQGYFFLLWFIFCALIFKNGARAGTKEHLLLFFFLILCKWKSMVLSLFYGDSQEQKSNPHTSSVFLLCKPSPWGVWGAPCLVIMVESGLGFGFKSRLWEFLQCWHVTLNSINDLAFHQPFGLLLSPSETSDLIQALCP